MTLLTKLYGLWVHNSITHHLHHIVSSPPQPSPFIIPLPSSTSIPAFSLSCHWKSTSEGFQKLSTSPPKALVTHGHNATLKLRNVPYKQWCAQVPLPVPVLFKTQLWANLRGTQTSALASKVSSRTGFGGILFLPTIRYFIYWWFKNPGSLVSAIFL